MERPRDGVLIGAKLVFRDVDHDQDAALHFGVRDPDAGWLRVDVVQDGLLEPEAGGIRISRYRPEVLETPGLLLHADDDAPRPCVQHRDHVGDEPRLGGRVVQGDLPLEVAALPLDHPAGPDLLHHRASQHRLPPLPALMPRLAGLRPVGTCSTDIRSSRFRLYVRRAPAWPTSGPTRADARRVLQADSLADQKQIAEKIPLQIVAGSHDGTGWAGLPDGRVPLPAVGALPGLVKFYTMSWPVIGGVWVQVPRLYAPRRLLP